MERECFLDDENWNEVYYINSHAVFMSYLSMAVKGLGFLVLTWTTVVLLGGFVSMLQKKDFWCLTFITLVQTAGIFDVNLNKKLGYVKNAIIGLSFGVIWSVSGGPGSPTLISVARKLLAKLLVFVLGVLFTAVLCPLAIVYVLGILMSAGISLWRLIEHDYSGNSKSDSDGEASNLAPAMDTLYYLALLQGVLFCYRFIMRRVGRKLAKQAAGNNTCTDTELDVLYNYLSETKTGCVKDPSFAKGRNLITHAIDKIGSNSPLDCIFGVKILYTAISIVERELMQLPDEESSSQVSILIGQRMLMKHMVVFNASSSRRILQKLLEMLNSRGIHDTETRKQASVIVERLAVHINLEDFPRGIQHISSLIGTFEEYSAAEPYLQDYLLEVHEQYWNLHARCLPPSAHAESDDDSKLRMAYKELLVEGMCILRKLAINENNCRVMSNTRGLVSKIMAPITSDLLHHTTDDHGAWSNVVQQSMLVMSHLINAPGETGAKLRREISSRKKAINTLQRILSCTKCNEDLQLTAIDILTRLCMDFEGSRSANIVVRKKESSSSREEFVRMLVDIFISDNKYSSSIRGYAGGAVSKICFHGGISDVIVVIQTSGDVDSLTKVLLHDKKEKCRQAAAEILEHLYTHYTKDDDLGKLKKATLEVIGEIIRYGDETHTRKEADQGRFTKPKTDIESQCYNGQRKGISSPSSSHQQNDEEYKGIEVVMQSINSTNLLSSLLSLCGTVYDTSVGCISELGPDLAPRLNASSFLNKLKEVVVKNSEHPLVENLRLCKVISKLVISMKKHSGNVFVNQDIESLIEALSTASRNMLDLDHSMVFRSDDSSESSKLDKYTLAFLVKQAQELHAMVPSTNVSG